MQFQMDTVHCTCTCTCNVQEHVRTLDECYYLYMYLLYVNVYFK